MKGLVRMVIVYTKPGCFPCKFTKNFLDSNGIEYAELSIYDHLDYIQELGYSSAPVVVVSEDTHWSGFRDTELEKLK